MSLLEYNGIEGMILLSELSRRRIRSITKLIKVGPGLMAFCADGQMLRVTRTNVHAGLCVCLQVGRQEPVMVLRVDKEKGYIDLSKRYVLQCVSAAPLAPDHPVSVLTAPPPAPPQACERGGHYQVRGQVQQVKAGALHHAPRGRDNRERPGGRWCRMAATRHMHGPLRTGQEASQDCSSFTGGLGAGQWRSGAS